MTTYNERKKALEAIKQQKIQEIQKLDNIRNGLLTEVVQIEGKLELLKELEHESLAITNDETQK